MNHNHSAAARFMCIYYLFFNCTVLFAVTARYIAYCLNEIYLCFIRKCLMCTERDLIDRTDRCKVRLHILYDRYIILYSILNLLYICTYSTKWMISFPHYTAICGKNFNTIL